MITITTQRESIILVDLLHVEYAHAHSTNIMHSLRVVFVMVLVIAVVGLGLNPVMGNLCVRTIEPSD